MVKSAGQTQKPAYNHHAETRFSGSLHINYWWNLAIVAWPQSSRLSRGTSQKRGMSNDVFSTRQVQNADSCMI
jgi:hypothetical protein